MTCRLSLDQIMLGRRPKDPIAEDEPDHQGEIARSARNSSGGRDPHTESDLRL